MAIRITQNSIAAAFSSDVQSIYARMARSQQQISDGRRITRPSDDPFGTGQVMGFDAQLADVHRYQTNAADSMRFMDAADSALDSVTSALQHIREKAVQAANGTNGFSDLQSIATEVQQIKEVIRDAINLQHGDEQYIFGGTATSTTSYAAPGNLYGGTATTMSRRIGLGQSVQINVPGDAVLGPNGANALDDIDQLITDIQGGNTAGIQAGITAMTSDLDRVLNVRTQLGASRSRLEVVQTRLDATEERLLAARTEVADVDAAEAFVEFNQQQTMYQAALAAGTRIMQTSILDFI
jgi:flagellar hook-associated protein 3 FlgL